MNRITFIAEDGTVLYDNQADAATMENHGDRKEIQEALKTGSGHAERTSKTLSQKTLYYALRLSDNSVLRVSSTQYSVWVLLMELVPPLIGIAVVMLILAAIMSVHMANKIVEPINNVDLEHPEENQIYEEVGPLLKQDLQTEPTDQESAWKQPDGIRKSLALLQKTCRKVFLLLTVTQ